MFDVRQFFLGLTLVVVAVIGFAVIEHNKGPSEAEKVRIYSECQNRMNTGEFSYSEILALCESKHP